MEVGRFTRCVSCCAYRANDAAFANKGTIRNMYRFQVRVVMNPPFGAKY